MLSAIKCTLITDFNLQKPYSAILYLTLNPKLQTLNYFLIFTPRVALRELYSAFSSSHKEKTQHGVTGKIYFRHRGCNFFARQRNYFRIARQAAAGARL